MDIIKIPIKHIISIMCITIICIRVINVIHAIAITSIVS